MGPTVAELVARIIDRIEDRPPGPGRPPMPTAEVIETLRFFLREGVQWRELRAADGHASGSTLRRRLDEWHTTALLRRVHAVLVRMARSGPDAAAWDVVVDSCSVRAKRGGELTGPNPTDRGKSGTKYTWGNVHGRGGKSAHEGSGWGRAKLTHSVARPQPDPPPRRRCVRRQEVVIAHLR